MADPVKIDPEQTSTEVYALLRVCEKLFEMSQRDGFLHPATMEELTHQYRRVRLIAAQRYQEKQAEEQEYQ